MGLLKSAIIGGAGVYAVKQISKHRAQRDNTANREQQARQYQHNYYPEQQQQWQSTDEKHRLSRSLENPDFQYSSPAHGNQPQQYHPHVLQFNDVRSSEQQAHNTSRPLYLHNSQYYPAPVPRGNMYTGEFQAEAPLQYQPAYRPQHRQEPKMGFVEPDEVLSTSDARSVNSRASNSRSMRDEGKIFLDSLTERAQSVRSDMQGKSPREYLEKVLSK